MVIDWNNSYLREVCTSYLLERHSGKSECLKRLLKMRKGFLQSEKINQVFFKFSAGYLPDNLRYSGYTDEAFGHGYRTKIVDV